MRWSNCAGPEITLIDTSPSRSILRSSLQLQRSPSTTFTVSSQLPMAEPQRPTWPSAELKERKICSDHQTSV
jgi:hypothetical protein